MTIIRNMIKKTIQLFGEKKSKGKNFFDYSSSEKKKIIEKAARSAAKMKRETVERYTLLFS